MNDSVDHTQGMVEKIERMEFDLETKDKVCFQKPKHPDYNDASVVNISLMMLTLTCSLYGVAT